METPEELRQRVHHEQRLIARLRLATKRLEEAKHERIWAIAAAHEAALSIRKIAAAKNLSPKAPAGFTNFLTMIRHTRFLYGSASYVKQSSQPMPIQGMTCHLLSSAYKIV